MKGNCTKAFRIVAEDRCPDCFLRAFPLAQCQEEQQYRVVLQPVVEQEPVSEENPDQQGHRSQYSGGYKTWFGHYVRVDLYFDSPNEDGPSEHQREHSKRNHGCLEEPLTCQ